MSGRDPRRHKSGEGSNAYLRFEHEGLPESVNKLYFVRGGRKILSTAGRRYKTGFVANNGGCPTSLLLRWKSRPYERYVLRIWFRMRADRLYNEKFGKDGRVKSPFKNIDVSNMVKLVEDSISAFVGIDDRRNWVVICQKVEDDNEGVSALLYPIERDRFAKETIDEAIRAVDAASPD